MKKKCDLIKGTRTDLAYEMDLENFQHLYFYNNKNIEVLKSSQENYLYHFIKFNKINDIKLKQVLKKELNTFLGNVINKHFLIVGLGNENYTADAIGPQALKYIKANSHLKNLGLDLIGPCISILEPGVLGQSGIESSRIIKCVTEEITPDIIILIDAYVCENVELLNKSIQITNEGIIPGSGLKSNLSKEISNKTVGIPTLVIGVPTALEIEIQNSKLIVSTGDVDFYISKIAQIIGDGINEFLYQI